MLRHLRSAIIPVLSLVIGLGGISFGLAGATLPLSPASSETDVPEETTAPEEPVSEDPAGEEPEAEPTPPGEDPLVEAPVAEDDGDAATDTAVEKWSTEGCPEGFTGNHGQYVSSTEDRPRNEAAHSECGKPVHGDDEGSSDDADEEGSDDEEDEDDSAPVEENAQTGKPKKGHKGAD